jgi:hypothetical protein
MTSVAYVGNFDPPHSTETHVAKALENLGHTVRRLPEQRMEWATLPQQVEGADLFMWTRTAGFDPADLEGQANAIKLLDIPTAGFHLDRWIGLNREPDIHRSPFFHLDYVFTADGGHDSYWREHGINHHWSPPAILSDEAKRIGVFRKEYAADIGFVGNLRNYGHPEWGPYRRQLYRFLALTYRGRFKLWEGGIRGQDLADLYASVKVLIGDSCLAGNATKYFSDRIPECLGRSGFLIHPRVEGVTDGTLYTEGAHLACYDLGNFDELRGWIDYFLANEDARRDIAANGRRHVLNTATYELRMERVVATTLGKQVLT